uniref:Protocadherin 2 alpha a 15 n=1 Tax=Xiphophorus couchianus TaxID=32473 RepID=A0A3B5L7H3_9TELE
MERGKFEARLGKGCITRFAVAMLLLSATSAQLRYSISEEVNDGTAVGNLVKDLGLDKSTLKSRKYRVVSGGADPLFYVNESDGVLYVTRRIDREEVCAQSSVCLINVKTVLEAPLEVHNIAVEVLDINDHSPNFSEAEKILEISESVLPGARFQLKPARDLDSGQFSIQQYKLSQDDHFRLEVRDKEDDGKIPILVLKKSLDREAARSHSLLLTALDGGKPPKSGDMKIRVNVLDVNDNSPVFSMDVYSATLMENSPLGNTVVQVNATDLDDGQNGEIFFSFGNSVSSNIFSIFDINKSTGQITVKGHVDYEQKEKYEIEIQASDKGLAPLTAEKNVIIKIIDVNDNAPEIEITSFSSSIPEDSRPGTTVALISVNDLDSGLNGKVICSIGEEAPFSLLPSMQHNMFSLTHLEISESALSGARFQLQDARDPDSGLFSVQQYKLSQNDHFRLEIKDRGQDGKIPVLFLHKPLDREVARSHRLLLTAVDGGKPPKSGTMGIVINVLDVNDNMPVFTRESYTVELNENSPVGTTVIQVNATDKDEGLNGEVVYSFGDNVNNKLRKLFEIDTITGAITVKGLLDYEAKDRYEIDIKASDKGPVPLSTEKSVIIAVVDLNDNAPEIEVTSLSSAIPEDSKPGRTVALISVSDKDSGVNGKVICSIIDDVPFTLTPSLQENMFSIVTKSLLDREHKSKYEVTIIAKDAGEPALSVQKTISVTVSDVNDNNPEFSTNPYNFYVTENNVAGASLFSLNAFDYDEGDNAHISYKIPRSGAAHKTVTTFLNINSETGTIVALKSFDFETLKTFQFQVVATDSGTPSLSSNVTVNVFILDQNDNAPVILYPLSSNGSAEGVEEIPRNVNAGHLVTKVRAYDADIGYSGWLLFSLQEVTDHSLFGLDRYTGQIRTLRSFTETDEAEHKLVILVKDNGNVSLSATATVIVKLVEPKEAFAASDVKSAANDDEGNDVTFYLMITLGAVSVLFIISIIVLIAMQCSKSTDYSSKYLQETNYDGTLCHSIQYRSGDKRYIISGCLLACTPRS